MQKYKIILSGSNGAGKRTLHDVLQKRNAEDASVNKDIGNYNHSNAGAARLYLGAKTEISIYRVKSQKNYDAFFNALKTNSNVLGLMILINCSAASSHEELLTYVALFKEKKIHNMVIGLTYEGKHDSCLSLEKAMKTIKENELVLPVFPVDVRNYNDIILMSETLVYLAGNDIT